MTSRIGKRWWGILLVAAVVAVGAFAAAKYVKPGWPPSFADTPLPNITASTDPSVIGEGEYLVKAVAYCTNCHLPKSQVVFTTPQITAKLIPHGGGEWDLGGTTGILRSPNLTPDNETGLGAWTDREIARALRYGIDRDGHPLIFMIAVGPMSDPDLQAIVSYLRSLPAQKNAVVPTQITLEGGREMQRSMPGMILPKPQVPIEYVPRGEASAARGAYLANGPATCFRCHSNLLLAPRLAVDGPPFAGSLFAQPDPEHPDMEINAPNLTPSARFGRLRGWTQEQFVARFRAGRAIKHSDMPWENFRLMSDADLISLYRYLQSLPPVDRDVGPSYRPVGWKPEPSVTQ